MKILPSCGPLLLYCLRIAFCTNILREAPTQSFRSEKNDHFWKWNWECRMHHTGSKGSKFPFCAAVDWFHYQEKDLFTGWHLGPRTASWWSWALLPSDLSGCHLGAEALGASWTKGTRVLEVGVNSWSEFWFHLETYCGEGNGNPLQCSCLENPRDGGAWWASVYGVAQSRTRLKRLSSSSSSRNVLISSNQDKISL